MGYLFSLKLIKVYYSLNLGKLVVVVIILFLVLRLSFLIEIVTGVFKNLLF